MIVRNCQSIDFSTNLLFSAVFILFYSYLPEINLFSFQPLSRHQESHHRLQRLDPGKQNLNFVNFIFKDVQEN
jgi:hypothetical protein